MPTSKRTLEIVGIFQKALKNSNYTEVNKLNQKELTATDVDLGARDKNSPYRLAIRQRINEMNKNDAERVAGNRHNSILWISIIGIIATIVIALIF